MSDFRVTSTTWPCQASLYLFIGTLAWILVSGIADQCHAQSRDNIDGIKFSKQEVELLKRLDQIQAGAHLSATMLKAAPFIQIFSSGDPLDMTVTIRANDWDQIYGALSGLNKIQACKTSEEITLWHDVDGNEYSNTKVQQFFENLQKKADTACR